MKNLLLIVFIVVAFAVVGSLSGCRQGDIKKVEAKLWLVDTGEQDAGEPSLYRIVKKPDGSEVEQFYYVRSNPEKMKEFACMLANDRKELYDAWAKCGCSL